MNYEFELKSYKGILTIEGSLSEIQSDEWKNLLLGSLDKCHTLEVNIDNITSFSMPCIRALGQVARLAVRQRKSLTIGTGYYQEAMSGWITEKMTEIQQRKIN